MWLAIQNRLTTGDVMRRWNLGLNTLCSFCGNEEETRNHHFFRCGCASDIWRVIARNLLGPKYTTDWEQLIILLTGPWSKYVLFLFRYALQTTVYYLWREQNRRRHGEAPLSSRILVQQIEKNIKNRINVFRKNGDHTYTEAMELWLTTR